MQMGKCVYLLSKGISIGIRLHPGMIHFSSFVAAMLHCNLVVLRPAELWIREHASLFSSLFLEAVSSVQTDSV